MVPRRLWMAGVGDAEPAGPAAENHHSSVTLVPWVGEQTHRRRLPARLSDALREQQPAQPLTVGPNPAEAATCPIPRRNPSLCFRHDLVVFASIREHR